GWPDVLAILATENHPAMPRTPGCKPPPASPPTLLDPEPRRDRVGQRHGHQAQDRPGALREGGEGHWAARFRARLARAISLRRRQRRTRFVLAPLWRLNGRGPGRPRRQSPAVSRKITVGSALLRGRPVAAARIAVAWARRSARERARGIIPGSSAPPRRRRRPRPGWRGEEAPLSDP